MAKPNRQRIRRLPVLLCLGFLVATAAPGGVASGSETATGAVGTVDTLAGPGFCAGPTVPDPLSSTVRAVAVNPDGSLFFDTGPPDRPELGWVDSEGRTGLVPLPIPPGERGGAGGPPFLSAPGRLAPDRGRGVLVAAGRQLLRFEPGGAGLVPVAGSLDDAGGASGDGGPGLAARLAGTAAVATDESGNAYLGDMIDPSLGRVAIRFLNRSPAPVTFYPGTPDQLTVPPGAIETVAGGDGNDTTDGARARQSRLEGRDPVVAVGGNRLYIGFSGTGIGPFRPSVRLVNLGGDSLSAHARLIAPATIQTVAGGAPGTGVTPWSGSLGGIATEKGDADLYLSQPDQHRVARLDRKGVISVVAGRPGGGPGDGGSSGNDGPAIDARLSRPVDVAIGPAGDLYLSDQDNGQVRVVDRAGFVRAAPGAGIGRSVTCRSSSGSNPAELPIRGSLSGVAVDAEGTTYFLTAHQVKRIDPSGVVETVAGADRAPCGPGCGDGGPAATAVFDHLTSLSTGQPGALYVLDGKRVRLVNTGRVPLRANGVGVAPGAIETVAGGGEGNADDGGRARDVRLVSPTAIGVDGLGDLLVGEAVQGPDGMIYENGRRVSRDAIRQVDQGGRLTTVCALSMDQEGRQTSDCGIGAPWMVVDRNHDLLFYPSTIHSASIMVLNLGRVAAKTLGQEVAPGWTQIVAGGDVVYSFGGDGGPALGAQFLGPSNLAVDAAGRLYIADVGEGTIRMVDAAGTIATVAGTGSLGFNGDGLKGRLTALSLAPLSGLTVDRCGNLLFADSNSDRVRRLNVAFCGPSANASARHILGSRVSGDFVRDLVVSVVAAVALTGGWALLRSGRAKSPGDTG